MADKLSASQVKAQYGIDRATLLAYENQGKLNPERANQGRGQRRYDPDDIAGLIAAPVVPPQTPNDFKFRKYGTDGLRRWGGAVYEERLRELRGRAGRLLLREMRLNDPVIAAVFYAIEQSLKQVVWRVKPASESKADKDAAEFLETCLSDLEYSWGQTLDLILEFLEQGFMLMEVTYKRRLGQNPPTYIDGQFPAKSRFVDGRVGWASWAPRGAITLADGYEWIYDTRNNLIAVRQMPEAGNGRIYEIPMTKLLHFRTTLRPSGTPEGIAIHRPAYTAYYFTKNLQEIEGIGIERDLAGIPVVYLGNDCSLNEDDPSSDFALAVNLVTNLRNDEQAGVVIPHAKMHSGASEGAGMLLELLSSSGSRAHDVSSIIMRYDKLKAITVLAQFILLGMEGGRGGSNALAETQSDLFALSVSAWLQNIAETINRHAIPQLFEFNSFPEITGLPQLVPSDTGLRDLKDVTMFINGMVGNNLIHYDIELERHLRQLARLPEPSDEDGATDKNERSVKDNTQLLTRLSSALQMLESTGVDNAEEVARMLGPIVEELQSQIGVSDALASVTPKPKVAPFGNVPSGNGAKPEAPKPEVTNAKR